MIYDRKEMKNLGRVFKDRSMAGDVIGRMLAPKYSGDVYTIILAIPMGGVPVALKAQRFLGCALDLMVVRKIQIPDNSEAGFGALTYQGDVFLNQPLLNSLHLTPDQVAQQTRRVEEVLRERNLLLRGARPFPDLSGRTVILVDDGLASGYTMKASIHMASRANAGKIVIAVPTAPRRTIDAFQHEVDEIYCANLRDILSFAVADAYENWHDLSDEQVVAMLENAGMDVGP